MPSLLEWHKYDTRYVMSFWAVNITCWVAYYFPDKPKKKERGRRDSDEELDDEDEDEEDTTKKHKERARPTIGLGTVPKISLG